MNNVLLISEETLKTYTAIQNNVQSDELRFCILQAQTIQIQESLGTNLYDKMLNLVETGDIYLSGNTKYKELLDKYIQPTLISYSYAGALDNFLVKFVAVGLVSNRSEMGERIDFKTFQFLKSNAKDQAEFNNNLLRRHLIFRSGNYPEYNSGSLNEGQLPPIPASPFMSPITLPTGAYNYRKNKWFNQLGPLCADSMVPTFYGSANNSPGVPKG
jgi:hypothetical protein